MARLTRPGPWFFERRLTPLGLAVLLTLLFGGLALVNRLRPSGHDAATRAVMEQVRQDEAVVAAVGEPVEIGGRIETRYASVLELRIPIRGPRGHAVIDAGAFMDNDKWWVDTLELTLPDGTQLNRTRPD